MKEKMVALEAAGSGLTDWVGRARREHTTFVVVEDGTPVARLAPVERRCIGSELAKAVANVRLSAEEAAHWSRDLRDSHAKEDPAGQDPRELAELLLSAVAGSHRMVTAKNFDRLHKCARRQPIHPRRRPIWWEYARFASGRPSTGI